MQLAKVVKEDWDMAAPLTLMELAGLIERLQLFNDIPPEQRTSTFDIVLVPCQHCEESTPLFTAVYGGKPATSETTQLSALQLCEHIKQCPPCGEFLRYVWRVTNEAGY